MFLVVILIIGGFGKVSSEITAVSEAKHDRLLAEFIKIRLETAKEVCYFEDHKYEEFQVLLRGFATKNFNSFRCLAQSSCDFYILCIKSGNVQSALKHLIPHTKVIVVNPKEGEASWKLESKFLFEMGLFPLALKSSYNNNVTSLQVTNLQANKTEIFHQGEDNLKFPVVPAWNPKDFFKMTGRRISVITFHCPPFVEVTGNRLEGLEHKIIHELIKDWPIEYKIIRDKDDGTLINKFLLAISSVQHRKSDIAFCFLWQRVLMERNVDFSTAMFPTCVTFLVHKPRLLQGYTFLFQAFHDIYTFIVFLLTTALLEIASKLFIADLWQGKVLYEVTSRSHLKLRLTSSRLCLVIIASFYFLFFSYYSAKLTVLSSFPRFSQNYVRSFSDMVERKIQWAEPKNDIQDWLKSTNDSICVGIAQNFRIADNRAEINKKLKSGQYGYLVKRFAQDFVSGSEELDDYAKTYLRLIPGCLATFYSSIAFQKNSPFPLYFDQKINSMFESGIVNYWRELTLRKRTYSYLKGFKSLYVDQMVTSKFDIDKLSGTLYFLLFGYGISLMCFIDEVLKGRGNKQYLI